MQDTHSIYGSVPTFIGDLAAHGATDNTSSIWTTLCNSGEIHPCRGQGIPHSSWAGPTVHTERGKSSDGGFELGGVQETRPVGVVMEREFHDDILRICDGESDVELQLPALQNLLIWRSFETD
jgi:hypothetical protein